MAIEEDLVEDIPLFNVGSLSITAGTLGSAASVCFVVAVIYFVHHYIRNVQAGGLVSQASKVIQSDGNAMNNSLLVAEIQNVVNYKPQIPRKLLALLFMYAIISGLYKGSLSDESGYSFTPPAGPTILLIGYWLAFATFWYMDLGFYFICGTCTAAVSQYYYIVQVMRVPAEYLTFSSYAFLVPCETGSINALGYYIATKWLRKPWMRYIITWCMGLSANIGAGLTSDYHNYYPGWTYMQYLSGSMALYAVVIFGIIPLLENIVEEGVLRKEMSLGAASLSST